MPENDPAALYNPAIHKIKVNTWGTTDKDHNEMDNFVASESFGRNPGHASLEMTLPITENSQDLIEKYCMKQTFKEYQDSLPQKKCTFEEYMANASQRIPVRLVKIETHYARYNTSGQLEKTQDIASKIRYYKIDFSFWPGKKTNHHYLSTLKEDMRNERLGRHFHYSESAKEYFKPEERMHKGTIGSQRMTYAPKTIIHQRDWHDATFDVMGLRTELNQINDKLGLKKLLESKVDQLTIPKIEGSLYYICKNMGLSPDSLAEEFRKESPNTGNDDAINQFKKFFRHKIDAHIKDLKERQAELKLALALPQVKKIEEQLIHKDNLIDKIALLKTRRGKRLESICKEKGIDIICEEMGLDLKSIIKEFKKSVSFKKGDKIDMAKFKKYFTDQVHKHASELIEIKEGLQKGSKTDTTDYVSSGIPPDHTEELPYDTSGRGLNAEAMLKKMKELTDSSQQFSLYNNNCSKISIAILQAGATDDLLKSTLGTETLGFTATPQQVLSNVKKAKNFIINDTHNTLLTRIANSNIINQILGGFIAENRSGTATVSKEAKVLGGLMLLGFLKTILNPSQSIKKIAGGTWTVFKKGDSLTFKINLGFLSGITIAALAPLALVEIGIKAVTAPIKALAHWMNQKPTRHQPQSPLIEKNNNDPKNDSYNKMVAKMKMEDKIAKKIAQRIPQKTIAVHDGKSALQILEHFEKELQNSKQIVTLNSKDFQTLNQYVLAKDDPNLTAKFKKCCDTTLLRANELSNTAANQTSSETAPLQIKL